MKKYFLCFTLLSDASFSRGDGLAGEVDSEIQQDDLGCPYLSGRALKGILVNECADLLAAPHAPQWDVAAQRLFGRPGQLEDGSLLHVGNARLPFDLRNALNNDLQARLKNEETRDSKQPLWQRKEQVQARFREEILSSLTAIRTQTSIDEDGVAKERSLRSQRVIIRQTPFEAELDYLGEDNKQDETLLVACVAAFRRAGSARNRGLGKLKAHLEDDKHQPIKPGGINAIFEGVKK